MQLNIEEIPEVPLTKAEKKRKYAREYMNKKYKENKEKYSRERLTNYYLKDNKMDMGLYTDYGTHASSILRVLTIVKKMEMIEPMKYIVDEINKLIEEASIAKEHLLLDNESGTTFNNMQGDDEEVSVEL